MLIEFSVKNFRSIKGQQTLSLVKGKGNEQPENYFTPEAKGAMPLLHSCAIYGANASGKSNLIKAMSVMQEIVLTSASKLQRGDELPVTPFLFDELSITQPTEFEIFFIAGAVRYQYGFSLTKTRVLEEWLLAYPEGRPQRWLSRIFVPETQMYEWKLSRYLEGKKQVWQEATRSNALFLTTAIQLNNKQLRPIYDWFEYYFRIIAGDLHHGCTVTLCKNSVSKPRIINFLKSADIDIEDVKIETHSFNSDNAKQLPLHEFFEALQYEGVFSVKTLHTSPQGFLIELDIDQESDGTQKLFTLAGPILDILSNGYIACIDEFHNHLHPNIVHFLVGLFHNPKTNPKNAQLIFTTHETSILNQDVFRRDQIWFCEKDDLQCTAIYPLSDFSPRKAVENLERNYLAGRYGALPYIRNL